MLFVHSYLYHSTTFTYLSLNLFQSSTFYFRFFEFQLVLSLLDSRCSKNHSELNSSNRDKLDAFECNGLCRNQWMYSLLTFLIGCWPPFSHRSIAFGVWQRTIQDKSLVDLASNLVSFLNSRWFHSNHTMGIWTAIWHKDIMLHWPRLRVTRAEWLALPT